MGKHFIFVSTPARGHVNPSLAVIDELARRGHRVTYVSGAEPLADVAGRGAATLEIPWTMGDGVGGDTFTTESFVSIVHRQLLDAAAVFEDLVAHFDSDRADVVVYDALTPVGPALANRLSLPAVPWIASFATNEHFPVHELLPSDFRPDHPALVQYATDLAAFAANAQLDIALIPLMPPPSDPTLVFVPREFQIAGHTYSDSHRFVGPALGSRVATPWRPPASATKLVFISLGTYFNDRPDFFDLCIDAFTDSSWHVVMAVGNQVALPPAGSLPPNFDIAARFDQLAVLAHASAFISHGGMGSVMEAVRLRVPVLGVPQVGEQRLNIGRLVELGLGSQLDSAPTASTLLTATDAVADDLSIRSALADFAAHVAVDGGSRAADEIEAVASAA